MTKQSVLQVVGDGLAGGGTTAVLELSRRLVCRGVPVHIASQGGSYLLNHACRYGIPTLALDFSTRQQTLTIARALASFLRDVPGMVVHAHGARAGLPVALMPSALRTASVYTVHGFHYCHKPPGLRQLAKAAERFCMQRTAATVFVSMNDELVARKASLLPTDAVAQVIYNGSPHAGPPLSPPTFDIAFLGRLHYQKNPEILPRILQALRPQRPTLCIIGGGKYEARLRELVVQLGLCGQVSFMGWQSHVEALRHLICARVMLLPSRWEGLPISVIEAMHCGIPVVASDVAGTAELVVDGETGFLVPPEDVEGYADRLRLLLDNEVLRKTMGARALERARSGFSIERQVDSHIALYSRIVDRAGGEQ